MQIEENVSLKKKTTMRIGGLARYYAELHTKKDVEEAMRFAQEKNLPLIVLGGGSNTIFEEGVVEGMVVKVMAEKVVVGEEYSSPTTTQTTVQSGKILASLINELAEQNLDLSPLTGIPGSLGGAIFGNAGQGPKGIWINHFVESVEFFWQRKWQTFTKEQCKFDYRESVFKSYPPSTPSSPPIIWSITLAVPSRPTEVVKVEIERLIQKRIETQPHLKTAGSCFKAVNGVPAWQLIEAVGLRGTKIGDVQIAEKHANFLLNTGEATFEDAKKIVEKVQKLVPKKMEVEMRFVNQDGSVVF